MSFQEFRVPAPPPILHEDWLSSGLPSKIRQLELIRDGIWPNPLRGWSVVVTCLWLLRCVYGSDDASLIALREHVENNRQLGEQVQAHVNQWPVGGCPDPLCAVCLNAEAADAAR